jgi:nucleolin
MEMEENKQNEEYIEPKCVFVSGIPYNTTEDEIREKFNSCGIIKEIKMPKYQDSGRNIGYAHIYFKKNNSIKKVIFFVKFGFRIGWDLHWY